jgi:hypothetical protein
MLRVDPEHALRRPAAKGFMGITDARAIIAFRNQLTAPAVLVLPLQADLDHGGVSD